MGWLRCDNCDRKAECVIELEHSETVQMDSSLCCRCRGSECDECRRLDQIRERSHRGVVKRFQASVEEADEILMQTLRDSITMAQWRKGNTNGTL